jgi:hypothetical protein
MIYKSTLVTWYNDLQIYTESKRSNNAKNRNDHVVREVKQFLLPSSVIIWETVIP